MSWFRVGNTRIKKSDIEAYRTIEYTTGIYIEIFIRNRGDSLHYDFRDNRAEATKMIHILDKAFKLKE